MKNKIIFGGLLLLGFASAHAELTYMDTIKSAIDANGFCLDRNNSARRGVDRDIIRINTIPFYISAANIGVGFVGEKSEQLEKVIQYNAWYNPHHMLYAIDDKGEFKRYNYGTRELFRKALVAEIVEPGIFLAADYGFEKVMNETEVGKTVAQSIPPFLKKNGKIVASAFVARAAGTVAKGESLSENAQAFGKSACMHLGSNALEEYVINPSIDGLMGQEDSYLKDGVKFLANGVILCGLTAGLNIGLTMLRNSTGSSEKSSSTDFIRHQSTQANALLMYNTKLLHQS